MEIEAAAGNGMGNPQLEDLRKPGFSKNSNCKETRMLELFLYT